MGKRFLQVNVGNSIKLPSGMILQKATYDSLKHFHFWEKEFGRRLVVEKERLKQKCGIIQEDLRYETATNSRNQLELEYQNLYNLGETNLINLPEVNLEDLSDTENITIQLIAKQVIEVVNQIRSKGENTDIVGTTKEYTYKVFLDYIIGRSDIQSFDFQNIINIMYAIEKEKRGDK